MSQDRFEWRGDHGWYPADPAGVYDADYFQKYQDYAGTDRGRALTRARMDLVRRHRPDRVVLDVGIGCGQFVEAMNEGGRVLALGHDVNPAGLAWLRARGVCSDPWVGQTPILTFWDSLEHLERPGDLLSRCTDAAFVAVPIFRDAAHARGSRHFRPDEHFWYWTAAGLVGQMREWGFQLLEVNDDESRLGREDIWSFAFARVPGA